MLELRLRDTGLSRADLTPDGGSKGRFFSFIEGREIDPPFPAPGKDITSLGVTVDPRVWDKALELAEAGATFDEDGWYNELWAFHKSL